MKASLDSIKLNLVSEYSIKVSALHDIYSCHKVAFYDNVAQNYAKQIMLLLREVNGLASADEIHVDFH